MKRKNGFSLIEMLVVIGIIAVLAGVMMTQFRGSSDSALAAVCLNNMRTLCNAVMANGSKESYYPSAGPYQYLEENVSNKEWWQGWIGNGKGNQKVSCYHDAKNDGMTQYYALTNGTIWRAVGGNREAYLCPAHTKYCKQYVPKVVPSWSYAMNSYFGWDLVVAPDITGGRREFGGGSLPFRYSSKPTTRNRPVERVLLFAEIPYATIQGLQDPEWNTSASEDNDMILQYPPGEQQNGTSTRANRAKSGGSEIIGFNHRSGNDYSAHVAFADGHCAKIALPRSASKEELKDLTSWLCTGAEYTFNGTKYEKVSE